ncbi:hypothetical protein SLEP1_g41728 [Rubroshorea leprosula]|uniref:Leucine-rich repeat-containing N-terminal plant-type domain-containing protein n=1 Tax=Rubroshorea leprosula TaxID=152421 RepID=A0AAV5L8T2_9ROSI|nr:hypothetical protein SLEP1_g41728 [Rubroshorea leprosula]
MGSLIWFSQILCLSFMLLQFRVQSSSPSQSSLDSSPHLCRPEERSALLDFKSTTNLVDNWFCTPRPIIQTWNESKDCCSWEGIACDKRNGHVIGLDLSSNCLEANLTTNSSLFRLEKLQSLNLAYNYFRYPNLSFGFDRWKSLTYLNLSRSGYMNGSFLFDEIFLLPKLVSLDLSNYYGLLLDNIKFQMLAHNLTELRFLILDYVNMSLVVPSTLLNLTSSLEHLSLRANTWRTQIWVPMSSPAPTLAATPSPPFDLQNNCLTGPVDHVEMPNLILQEVYLSNNEISGSIPSSFFDLVHLTRVNLSSNNLTGTITPDMLSKLVDLEDLDLSNNSLLSLSNNGIGVNHSFPNLRFLIFSSCNIHKFPSFLRKAERLEILDISKNKISGQIHKWEIEGMSSLYYLDLSYNFLTGIDLFGFGNLEIVDLRSNILQGSLPILSTTQDSMQHLFMSGNNLTSVIPSSYCNLTSLKVLDLGNNCLGGKIPECLGNLSDLSDLDLRMNKFHGIIPNSFVNGSRLRNLNLNGNQLEGRLPSSLGNCSELEVLDVGYNSLNDTFPCWLGVLLRLKVLILRSNQFHGAISNSMPAFYFPQLRIIDVAQNDFMGLLPSNYFKILKGMRDVAPADKAKLEYIGDNMQAVKLKAKYIFQALLRRGTSPLSRGASVSPIALKFSVKVVMKGLEVKLERIMTIFTTIDFSSNRFHGEIPKELGELNSLLLLNICHNSLSGQIPSSLGKLAELESLDLSSNKLEGRIPEQLTKLTFLSVLNLSHNELVGHIPEGKQFSTFSNDSYVGNSGLCGFPLTKKCEPPRPPSPQFDEEDDSTAVFEWKFALAGYGCGLVLGLSLGYIAFTTGKPWWVQTGAVDFLLRGDLATVAS